MQSSITKSNFVLKYNSCKLTYGQRFHFSFLLHMVHFVIISYEDFNMLEFNIFILVGQYLQTRLKDYLWKNNLTKTMVSMFTQDETGVL